MGFSSGGAMRHSSERDPVLSATRIKFRLNSEYLVYAIVFLVFTGSH